MKSFFKVIAIIFLCQLAIGSVLTFPVKDLMVVGTNAEIIGEVIGHMLFNIAMFCFSIVGIIKLYLSFKEKEPQK